MPCSPTQGLPVGGPRADKGAVCRAVSMARAGAQAGHKALCLCQPSCRVSREACSRPRAQGCPWAPGWGVQFAAGHGVPCFVLSRTMQRAKPTPWGPQQVATHHQHLLLTTAAIWGQLVDPCGDRRPVSGNPQGLASPDTHKGGEWTHWVLVSERPWGLWGQQARRPLGSQAR